jgi:hypothetical protein
LNGPFQNVQVINSFLKIILPERLNVVGAISSDEKFYFMKTYFLAAFILVFQFDDSFAQHVRARMEFPVGTSMRPVGAAPFRGAIWIGPEWRWQRGQYILVPGYWAKPNRRGSVWLPGSWSNTRRGFIWKPGRWR